MSGLTNEYKLENYKKISPLNKSDNLWLVTDSVTQKQFVMRKINLGEEAVFERLMQIHNPNVVEVIDVFSCKGKCYVIEEHIDGSPLSEIPTHKQGKGLFSVAKQILTALQTIHDNGIIHRDLKPENIMMDKNERVKLIDFHIARVFSENKENDTTIKGSSAYAPPEQFGFSQTDFRADIYSFGVTLNELAVHKLPEEELCKGPLKKVVRKCTELDPKRRYQSCEQVLAEIRRLEQCPKWALVFIALLIAVCVSVIYTSFSKDNVASSQKDSIVIAELADRIVCVKDSNQYPAMLIEENESKKLFLDLNEGKEIYAQIARTDDLLSLDISVSDGETAKFQFEDMIPTESNLDTTLSYEILFHDIDQNGVDELLVSLSRREQIDTPNIQNRYFLTDYSLIWVVYENEQGFAQSKPLLIEEYLPVLDGEELIRDSLTGTWYFFKDGEWASTY